MNKKKIQKFIDTLQDIVTELNENPDMEEGAQSELSKEVEKAEELTTQVAVASVPSGKTQYFRTVFEGREIPYGTSFALEGGKYFTVEVDYTGLLASYGRTTQNVKECILRVWGRSRMAHYTYHIYSLGTNEFFGEFQGYQNLYDIDLAALYRKYGSANFKFLAQWGTAEAVSLDQITLDQLEECSISITTPPTKTSYAVGGSFDATGMVVKVNYTDGTSKQITDYTVSSSPSLTRADKYVTVKYKNYSAKQPIDVVCQKVPYTRRTEMRTRKTENGIWGKWEYSPSSNAIYATPTLEYRVVVTIDKSKIDMGNYKKTGLKLYLNLKNPLSARKKAMHVKVNNMRVTVVPGYSFLFAYIGELKAGESGNLEVIFEYDDYGLDFEIGNIYFCNENDPAIQTESKGIDLVAGKLNLNIPSGEVNYEFTDIDADSMPLGIGISHILCKNNENLGYGDYYRLNLCEKLDLDVVNINDSLKSHIYTDACGNRHGFNIIFYYMEDGERVYITGEEIKNINYSSYGFYEYNGKYVHIEQITVNNQIYLKSVPSDVANNEYYKSLAYSNNDNLIPEKWLQCDTYTKGFNKNGNLVFMMDSYENYISIIYNADEKIEEVKDGKGNYVKFYYNIDGNLDYLMDSRSRKIKYLYLTTNTGCIVDKVDYCTVEQDGITENVYKSFSLNYHSINVDGERIKGLISVLSSDEVMSLLTYDNSYFNSRLACIRNFAILKDAENDEELSKLDIAYDYDKKQIILTDDYDNQEVYRYTDDNMLCNYFEVKNGKVSAAEEYSYEPYSSYTVKKASLETLNQLPLDNFTFTSFTKTETKLNIVNLPEKTTFTDNITDKAYKTEDTDYTYNTSHKCIKTVLTQKYFESSSLKFTNIITTNFIYNSKGKIAKISIHKARKVGETVTNEKVSVTEFDYDGIGSLICQTKYNLGGRGHSDGVCNCTYASATDKFITNYGYDLNHRMIKAWSDDGLSYNEYTYYDGTNCIKCQKHTGKSNIYYGYDAEDRLSSISGTINGVENANYIDYDFGDISKINHSGNNAISFEYNTRRNISCIKIGDAVYETYDYEYNKARGSDFVDIITKVNAKDESFKIIADRAGKYVITQYNNTTLLTEEYGTNGQVSKVSDNLSGRNKTLKYDKCGNLMSFEEVKSSADKFVENITYNAKGNIATVVYNGIVARTENYTYSGTVDESVTQFKAGSFTVDYQYDINGRCTGRAISIGTNEIHTELITYRKINDRAIYAPVQISYTYWETTSGSLPSINNVNLQYGYDVHGNIASIKKNGSLLSSYSYDGLNRLIRENNNSLGTSYFYTYDNNGNILSKESCPFTTGSHVTGTGTVKAYSYDGDKLLSYNGESCVYDAVGNPITYRGKTLTWSHGRRLDAFGETTFVYDGQGRRIKKNDIEYYYDSCNRLIKSSNGMEYFYDQTGLLGFKLGTEYYYYNKDAQGNIIAILDSTGAIVVEYKYDAWGYHTISGSNTALGVLNPFRYRSYYFDTETKLYYLQSRYYDPVVGRFINMDSIDYADPETINGLNLYAYCNNNPVMNVDPSGHLFFTCLLIGLIAGAVIGATVNGVNAYNDGARGWELVGEIATGAVIGGAIGAAAGAIVGAGAALIGTGLSAIGAGMSGAFALAGGGSLGAGVLVAAGAGAVVAGGAIAASGVIASLVLMSQWVQGSWPGDDPTVPPGDGFVWRGPGEIGSEFGEWYNPNTGDQLHPDLKHKPPKGPHWGWRNKIMKIFRDIFKLG